MKHDVHYPELMASLRLFAKSTPAFSEHLRVGRGNVYQIRRVGDDRLHGRLLPGTIKGLRLLQRDGLALPLALAPRKYLHRLTAESICAREGLLQAPSDRDMSPYTDHQ